MDEYTGGSTDADHLCVVVHAQYRMLTRRSATQPWGHPNHARNVVKALRAKHGRDQLYVPNAKRTAGTLTYDGSDVGGERVCLEIEQEELALIASRGGKIIKLSVVGYDNECEDRDGKVLAVERAEERAATAPGKELALLPWQLEAIWDLDALGWRKNLVWIQRHWHAHAAHHHPDGQRVHHLQHLLFCIPISLASKKIELMSIENLKTFDPFAEADEDTGQAKKTQEYIHIRIQQRNGRKTLTTVQGIPPKFDMKKILKVIKKDFACNGTIISDTDSKGLGEVVQLQGDQRNRIKEFLTDKENGLGLDEKTIKVHGF
ncbi:hypothetical protein P8C59_003045 [Phyllachora maydis]|uniref:SUI1 domain-containing protein n=1 Tax=Phyllachora maydis TaxID=1825666 RepID=A0AAD9HZM6_9PEZI|nr:hypothetical protein P8C59_003045 [Phyllachora maydis]